MLSRMDCRKAWVCLGLRLGLSFGLTLVIVAGSARADGFRDAMMSVPADPTAADHSTFATAWQGTWVADFESPPGYSDYMDVIDSRFLLVRSDMTRHKNGPGTNTMIRRWQPGKLQRVPIDGWTRDRYATVVAEDRQWHKTHDNQRRKIDVGALLLLRYGTADWIQDVLERAVDEGVQELWTAELNLESPRALQYGVEDLASMRGWEDFDDSQMWVVLAGDRVYVGNAADRDIPLWSYRRRAALGTEVDPGFDRSHKGRLTREYSEWRGRCELLRDADLAPEATSTCDAFRDSYLKLGLEQVENRDLRRQPDSVVESAAEEAFWKAYAMTAAVDHQPYLDYCNLGLTGEQHQALYRALGERNFERTAWVLGATVLEKETSWDRETYLQRSGQLMGWKRNLWLREDGVIGVRSHFDEVNRWSVEDGALILRFGELTIRSPFGPNMMPLVDNKTATHLANYNLQLVGNHYELYAQQERVVARDHPHFAEIVAEIDSLKCSVANPVPTSSPTRPTSTAAVTAPEPESVPEPESTPVPAPKPQPAPQPEIEPEPEEMPRYWHMRVEPARTDVSLPAPMRALWDKGFYVFLRDDGKLGFNTDHPGPYFYQGTNTWKQEGQRLTLSLDGLPYVFELPGEYAGSLTALDGSQREYKMSLAPKGEGAR